MHFLTSYFVYFRNFERLRQTSLNFMNWSLRRLGVGCDWPAASNRPIDYLSGIRACTFRHFETNADSATSRCSWGQINLRQAGDPWTCPIRMDEQPGSFGAPLSGTPISTSEFLQNTKTILRLWLILTNFITFSAQGRVRI